MVVTQDCLLRYILQIYTKEEINTMMFTVYCPTTSMGAAESELDMIFKNNIVCEIPDVGQQSMADAIHP